MRTLVPERTLFTLSARRGLRCWRLSVGLAWLLGSAMASAVSATLSVPAVDYDGTFKASWNVDPGPNQGGYTQLKQRVNGGSWVLLVQKGFGSQSHTVTVNASGTYEFVVHHAYMPQNPCGGPGCNPQLIHGDTVVKATAVTLTAPARAPTLSLPTTDSDGSYTVSWNSVSGAATYQLQQKVGTGSWSTVQSTSARSKSYSGQSANTYRYRVRSCNPNGCSAFSSEKQIAIPPRTPGAISGPSTDRDGAYSLSWGSSSGATSYVLQRQLNGGTWSTIQNTSSTSRSESGLGHGSYGYRVRACSAAGCSTYTSVKEVEVPYTVSYVYDELGRLIEVVGPE